MCGWRFSRVLAAGLGDFGLRLSSCRVVCVLVLVCCGVFDHRGELVRSGRLPNYRTAPTPLAVNAASVVTYDEKTAEQANCNEPRADGFSAV